MAEPVTKTPDFPNFDVYPGSPPRADRELPAHASQAREIRNNTRLNDTAERIGTAAGTAVKGVQELRQRFEVIRGRGAEAAGQRASEIADRATQLRDEALQRAAEWKDVAAARASELKDVAANRAVQLRDAAAERVRVVRARSQRLVNERPLQVIAGAAILGLIAGIALRLWRSNHE
jgi:ElaB/YqjD/DUF883 family membrane-anchored ribosome-binding protein